MTPPDIGRQYDKIAQWWQDYHINSDYGVAQVERALAMASKGGKALDVGCGAGGRLVRLMKTHGFDVTGLDASAEMIKLAQGNHPDDHFFVGDICHWDTDNTFDFILAWDSLFHLPLNLQEPVLSKLCKRLSQGGIMIHSFGDAVGAHIDEWHGQTFHYSSVGVTRNIDILRRHGLSLRHLELDQFPEKHAYIISQKM